MSFLRSIFGPSKEEIWSQIAADIGGEFIDGGFWGRDALVYEHGEWTIVLDTYTVSTGKSSTTFTRLRAPFVNRDGLYFKVYREGFLSGMGRFFGMQDIEIGDPFFDDHFVIKGNDTERIRLLLEDDRLKELIDQQPRIMLEVRDDEGWFGAKFTEDTDELYFCRIGILKETALLRGLFDLFTHTLSRLVQIDSAYADDPNVRLV